MLFVPSPQFRQINGQTGTYPGFPWRVRDVSRLGAQRGYSTALRVNDDENRIRPCVRSHGQPGGTSSKRVQYGEPIRDFSTSRYLIDFIAGVSDVSSGLAPHASGPGVDSNSLYSTSIPQTSRRCSTMRANFRMADDASGAGCVINAAYLLAGFSGENRLSGCGMHRAQVNCRRQ
jgi:hypothetical protein